MRAHLRLVAAIALVAGPTALAFFSGGFYETPRIVAGIGAWLLVAVAALASPRPWPRTLAGSAAVGGLAALAGWTGVSYEWAPIGERAQADAQRLVLYLGTFVAGIGLLVGPRLRVWLGPALAGGALIVTLYGLSERLLPGLLQFQRSQSAQGRLEQPLTYWNGIGCLAAIGLVLCLRSAADFRQPVAVRVGAAAGGVSLSLGVYLSFSRGALFAVAVGVAALVLLAPDPRTQAKTVVAVLAAGVAASVLASLLPRVGSLPPGSPGDQSQGLIMLAGLLALAALAAVATARIGMPDRAATRSIGRGARRVLGAACVVLVVGGLAGVAALNTDRTARSAGEPTSAKRFGSTDSVRYAYWAVTLEQFADDPVAGRGAGGFASDWRARADRPEPAVDAHSLYLETLGELGLVGAAFLALFFAGVAVAGVKAYRLDAAAATGPLAALSVWAVHAGLDWDWELPAVTGVALLCAAAMVAWQDEVVA